MTLLILTDADIIFLDKSEVDISVVDSSCVIVVGLRFKIGLELQLFLGASSDNSKCF